LKTLLKYFIFVLVFNFLQVAIGQSVWKKVKIKVQSSTVAFDSIPIQKESIQVVNLTANLIPATDYQIDDLHAALTWIHQPTTDSCWIQYKTLPLLFLKPSFHKDVKSVLPVKGFVINPFIYEPDNTINRLFEVDKGLNYAGNYTRGISLGNSQSLVTNSNFNLQLNGTLGNDVQVNAAMTDNSIPIQPEGNTAQIQDFDKIFIQLKKGNRSLLAGDLEFNNSESYFLKFNKKLQGLLLKSIDTLQKGWVNKSSAAIAITRGKYARNLVNGIERNQGPYRLKGNSGEVFIIIIAGTEKVFIDGELMKRGAEYDYTIDYNLGELIFTPNRLVTANSRISIEFQYAEKNYLRTTVYLSEGIQKKNTSFTLKVYNESDAKNQPQEPFKRNEQSILKSVGDSIDQAFISAATKSSFDVNKIMYQQKVVFVNGIADTIYAYSTKLDSAFYIVSFSLVGLGLGDYEPLQNLANGKVYQYVGKNQGSFLPILKLTTPKQQTMVTLLSETSGKNWKLGSELAWSRNDKNTFSNLNNADNDGFASKLFFQQTIPIRQLTIQQNTSYEYVQARFSPIENFRTIEFNRDWNAPVSNKAPDQHIIQSVWNGRFKNGNQLQYGLSGFYENQWFKAYKQDASAQFRISTVSVTSSISALNSKSSLQQSQFIRPTINVYQQFKKLKGIKLGVKSFGEWNSKREVNTDTLDRSSFQFKVLNAYISSSDTAKNKLLFSAERRWNYQPFKQLQQLTTEATNFQSVLDINSLKNQHLVLSAIYRRLTIIDSAVTTPNKEGTILGNLNYESSLINNLIHYQVNYETGTIQELKRTFAFLKVPDGQGHFSWVDLNGDNVQQYNEFTENDFSSNLSYEKVLLPTTTYVRANQINLNQSIIIDPVNTFGEEEGSNKWYNRLSLQANMQYVRKVLQDGSLRSFQPYATIVDSLVVSENSQYQAQLFINRSHTVFGSTLGYLSIRQKALLNFGFETKTKEEWKWQTRLNWNRHFSNSTNFTFGYRSNLVDLSKSQQYHLVIYTIEPALSILFNPVRATIGLNLKKGMNKLSEGGDSASIYKISTEIKYAAPGKSQFIASFAIAKVDYNRAYNAPVAFVLLEGLKTGENYIWSLNWERKLAKGLEMNIIYDGRKTGAQGTVIHTGRASLRALF